MHCLKHDLIAHDNRVGVELPTLGLVHNLSNACPVDDMPVDILRNAGDIVLGKVGNISNLYNIKGLGNVIVEIDVGEGRIVEDNVSIGSQSGRIDTAQEFGVIAIDG